jgi:hypothetical protein
MGFLQQYFHDVDLGVDQVDQTRCAIVGDKMFDFYEDVRG